MSTDTEHTTPTTLSGYDKQQRLRAAHLGRPVVRMSCPSLPHTAATDPAGTSAVFFWVKNGSLVCAQHGDAAPTPATAQKISVIFDAPGRQIVALDRAAANRIMRLVSQSTSSRGNSAAAATGPDGTPVAFSRDRVADLHKQLKFIASLPVSSRFCVLTTLLARKFWLPADKDVDLFPDWRSAFGLDASFDTLRELLAQTMSYTHPKPVVKAYLDPYVKFVENEDRAVNSIIYPGASSNAVAFIYTERLGVVWDGIERTDPILRHRGVVDGSVTRLSALTRADSGVEGIASQPFKLREGTVLAMSEQTDDAKAVEVNYHSTTVTDDQVHLGISPMPRAKKADGFAVIDVALAAHESVLLTAKPFTSSTRLGGSRRWATLSGNGYDQPDQPSKQSPAGLDRELPLDVILAGTPTL